VFGFGGQELGIILIIILVVFGPSQIPKMARSLGQAMREFKKAQREIQDEIDRPDTPHTPPAPPESKTPPTNKPIN
jgi:sec-independent protein translocase protein TatA